MPAAAAWPAASRSALGDETCPDPPLRLGQAPAPRLIVCTRDGRQIDAQRLRQRTVGGQSLAPMKAARGNVALKRLDDCPRYTGPPVGHRVSGANPYNPSSLFLNVWPTVRIYNLDNRRRRRWQWERRSQNICCGALDGSLSGLRRRPPVPRFPEGRRPLQCLRRGPAPSPRRRLPGLPDDHSWSDTSGRADRDVCRDRLPAVLLAPYFPIGLPMIDHRRVDRPAAADSRA
jgi:hypothetical protein